MSFLLTKSKQNEAAFARLKELRLFAAAVHCGYYFCIQKIIHILKDYYTDEYEAGLEQLKGGNGNRHKFYIDEFSGRFSKDRRDRRDVKNLLFQLRDLRIEADYHDIEITESKIDKVQSTINKIQLIIRRNLHL